MRTVLMLAAVLVVSLLIFENYSFDQGGSIDEAAGTGQLAPVQRAQDVDPLIQQAAEAQRQAIQQQLQ